MLDITGEVEAPWGRPTLLSLSQTLTSSIGVTWPPTETLSQLIGFHLFCVSAMIGLKRDGTLSLAQKASHISSLARADGTRMFRLPVTGSLSGTLGTACAISFNGIWLGKDRGSLAGPAAKRAEGSANHFALSRYCDSSSFTSEPNLGTELFNCENLSIIHEGIRSSVFMMLFK